MQRQSQRASLSKNGGHVTTTMVSTAREALLTRRTQINAALSGMFTDEELADKVNEALFEELCDRTVNVTQQARYFRNDPKKIGMFREALELALTYLDERTAVIRAQLIAASATEAADEAT